MSEIEEQDQEATADPLAPQKVPVKIRQAQPLDVSNVARLLIQAHDDGENNQYPEPDMYMTVNWVTNILTDGYVLVAEKAGRIIGTIAVTNYRFPWAKRFYLYVDWMYVSTKFRDGAVFDGLLKALHAYADERGAPIFGGVSSGKDAKMKDRLMSMAGYQYLGGQFIRDQEVDDG